MTRHTILALTLLTSLLLAACAPQETSQTLESLPENTKTETYASASANPVEKSTPSPVASATPTTKGKTMTDEKTLAVIETAKGKIEVELYPDKAPNTVKNFLEKAKSGFYNNLTFHRVEDWVIQGGDPVGNGTGGGKMEAEYNDIPFVDGSLGIARGMDKAVNNDSQFFICTADCGWLTNEYTNFGTVTKGLEIAKKIAIGDKILSVQTK